MMSANRKWWLWILAAAMLLLFLLDLRSGSATISWRRIIDILWGGQGSDAQRAILLDIRLPRALTAVLAGAGLSVAGVMMQAMFRNPLAGPYVLGISSGASLFVAIYVLAGGMGWMMLPHTSWMMALFAIAGSTGVLLMVLFVSLRVRDSVSLLIIGIMIAGITSSVVSILQYFSAPALLQYFIVWTFGSLSGVTSAQLAVLGPVVLTAVFGAFLLQKSLNTIMIGDNYARLLGVSLRRLHLRIIVLTGLLAGSVTAFAGPIVFLGVAVPHLSRSLFKTVNHSILIPASALTGAALLLLCDILSRLPLFGAEIPINAVTSLIGAPVIIWIIVKNRRLRTANF